MAGLEFLSVAGCITALCSSYCEGSRLVAQMRAKRREGRLQTGQPAISSAEEEDIESLQSSLVSGNKDIRQQFERELRRFGRLYEEGDREARDQLTQIIIIVQQQIIQNLHRAWREDDYNDFQHLRDTSDDTRNDSIMCLISLQKRMAAIVGPLRSPTGPIMSPTNKPISPSDSSYKTQSYMPVSAIYPSNAFQNYVEEEESPDTYGPLPVSLGFPSRVSGPPPPRKHSASYESPAMLGGTPIVMQPWPSAAPPPPPPPKDTLSRKPIGGDPNRERKREAATNTVTRLVSRTKTADEIPNGSSQLAPRIEPSREAASGTPNTIVPATPTSPQGIRPSLTSPVTSTSPQGSRERVPSATQISYKHDTFNEATGSQTPVPPPPPYQPRSPSSAKAEQAPTALTPIFNPNEGQNGFVDQNPLVHSPSSQHSVRLNDAIHTLNPPTAVHPALRPDSQDSSRVSSTMSWAFSSDDDDRTSHSSPTPSRVTPATTNGPVTLPNEDNNFLGFCKGAWRMQIGERSKAVKELRIPMGYSLAQNIPYFCCTGKKCNFEGRVAVGGKNFKDKVIDRQIFAFTGRGYYIRYRWSLLFKMHVPSKARGAAASGNHQKWARIEERHAQDSFKCIFCCVTDPNAPIIGGISSLMLHLGREHIGVGKEPSGALLLDRVKCVIGYAAAEDEDWDVNLIDMPAGSKVEEFYGSPREGSFVSR